MTAAEQFRLEGRAEGLLDLLAFKFGSLSDRIVGLVRIAEESQLRTWNARVLTANTLDEVFAK
ncbi:hypothetical protein [Nocardia sp. NPDC056000]|uniref:hypothetical protein n=1 Tax=Nocardia sp. NPDC056000 TaxID=3345674 RepID=UPI0035E1CE4F